MPLTRILGRTGIIALHAAFVPSVAWLLNGNWPTEAPPAEMALSLSWAVESTLALIYRSLPRACVDQPIVTGVNSIWRHLALAGWWSVGYLLLFVGVGHIIRQLPDYWRRLVANLQRSAIALAKREADRQAPAADR